MASIDFRYSTDVSGKEVYLAPVLVVMECEEGYAGVVAASTTGGDTGVEAKDPYNVIEDELGF